MIFKRRRGFLKESSALAAASFLPVSLRANAEPPPEIRRLVLNPYPITCLAPIYIADVMLKAEGFTEIEYRLDGSAVTVGPGRIDFDLLAVCQILLALEANSPVVTLATMHLGCYELFAKRGIRSIRDLKGKTIPVDGLGGGPHAQLSCMMAYVGLDPKKDVNWVVVTVREGVKLMASGKADAYLAFPPEPEELRAAGVDQVILNTATDKPWSQYGCCMLATHREFASKYPVATRRAMRAFLKAADFCAAQPERAARIMVEKQVTDKYEKALLSMRDLRYDVWRDHDPGDSMRFYGNRLYEVGMIKTSPNKLIAKGYDARLLEGLKREIKA
ncbi:MAG: ABC transporter substrate-binding protein [Burkholderiales bacterium]